FPWMIDFRIDTRTAMTKAHDAVVYLSDEAVVAAIGYALFGSKSTELAEVRKGVDIPLDAAEQFALLALRYAYLLKMKLDGDVQDRWAGALRQVQATAIADIKLRNDSQGRTTPSSIARLAFDFSDPQGLVPEPLPANHITKDEAVLLLTVL